MTPDHGPLPAEAAQRLRDAARLIADNGHTREMYQSSTGALCLDGALQLAFGVEKLVLNERSARFGAPERLVMMPVTGDERERRQPLYDQAVAAVAEQLPRTCDNPNCGNGHTRFTHPLADDPGLSNALIHHYNDYLCDGGEEAQLLLIQTAEKIEANL